MQAKLIVYQPHQAPREFPVDGVVYLGRDPENTLVIDSAGVSKFHARVYARQNELWVADLESTNGTYVNETPIEGQRRLQNGDSIGIGEDVSLLVVLPESHLAAANLFPSVPFEQAPSLATPAPALPGDTPAALTTPPPAPPVSPAPPPVPGTLAVPSQPVTAPPVTPPSGPNTLSLPTGLLVAGSGVGALLFLAVAAFVVSRFWPATQTACSDDMLTITAPRKGDTITRPTKIRTESKGNTACIANVIFKLKGEIISSDAKEPYEAELDPDNFKTLAAQSSESLDLTVTVIDQDGKPHVQEDAKIYIYLETATTRATPTPAAANPPPESDAPTPPPPAVAGGATRDVRDLASRLATQISGKSGYLLDEPFVNNVNRFTKEYRTGGYDKAYPYRRTINKAFNDQGIDALFGYLLAYQRSQFDNRRSGRGLGFWQLPPEVVNGYLSGGETAESAMTDPERSAVIAAQYTKQLLTTFNDKEDFMYVVACYGLPLNEVGKIRTALASQVADAAARRNFSQAAQTLNLSQAQVEQVHRFFAAGIVGENPQIFGGTRNEKSLSDLK